jgi:hypothetical protein
MRILKELVIHSRTVKASHTDISCFTTVVGHERAHHFGKRIFFFILTSRRPFWLGGSGTTSRTRHLVLCWSAIR